MTASLRILQGTVGQMPEACALLLDGQRELVAGGLSDMRVQIFPGMTCLLASVTTNGRDFVPSGVMAYYHDEAQSRMWIEMSYVPAEARGQGIYKTMYAALKRMAIEKRCRSIESGTHVKNTTMRAVYKRMGRQETFVYGTEQLDIELADATPR